MSRSILILTNRVPYPLHDGGALAMDAMIRGYHKAGLQVSVLAMNTSRHFVTDEICNKLYPQIAGFYSIEVDNKVSIKGILKNLLFSREPEHAKRFSSKAFEDKLAGLLQSIKPDIVQLESPFLAGYLPLIRGNSKALLVYRMHNIEAQIWDRLASKSSGLKRQYLKNLSVRIKRYEAALWGDVDLLLPITEADAQVVKQSGIKTPITVAPFGIEVAKVQNKLSDAPFKVYHIGAMDWLPNQEAMQWFLKEVWPKVYEKAPRLTFHFAGRAMPSSFEENLPVNVFCDGEVKDAEAFISDKSVLVVPLRSGSGIRVKILEAMALGKVVISTETGMQGIEAKNDIHYLKANTAADFVRQLVWANDHPESVKKIADLGREFIGVHYNSEAIMAQIVQRFDEMLIS